MKPTVRRAPGTLGPPRASWGTGWDGLSPRLSLPLHCCRLPRQTPVRGYAVPSDSARADTPAPTTSSTPSFSRCGNASAAARCRSARLCGAAPVGDRRRAPAHTKGDIGDKSWTIAEAASLIGTRDGPVGLYSASRLRARLACRGRNNARDRSYLNHPRYNSADHDRCPRCRQSLVRDLYPTKLYLCHVRAMPSPGVRTWRMVSAQSVP